MAIVNSVSPSITKDPGYYGKTVAHSDLVKFGIDGTRHMAKQGVSTVEGSVIHAANMADVSAVSATDGRATSMVLVYRTSDRDAADVCSFCLVDRESGQVITAGPSFSHVDRFNADTFPDANATNMTFVGYWANGMYHSPQAAMTYFANM